MYKLIFAFTLVIVALALTDGQKLKCGKAGQKKLDDVIQEMATFGHLERQYPTTEAGMRAYCAKDRANEKYLSDYAALCLDKLSQQVIGLLSYSVSATNRKHCVGRRKRAFLKWAPCGNSAKPETAKCWQTLNAFLPRISKAPNKWKIPMVCCVYFDWKQCTLEAYRNKGPKVCPEASVTGYESLIDAYAIDVLRLLCGDYTEDSDKCGPLMRKIPKGQKNDPTYNSPLNPFVEILKSIE